MSESGVVYVSTGTTHATEPGPGMQREVLAYNPHLMLVRHRFEKGWTGPSHSHPHHQLVYVISGRIRLEAEGKSWELQAGDSIAIEGGLEHMAAALEDSEALDVFAPYREDFV